MNNKLWRSLAFLGLTSFIVVLVSQCHVGPAIADTRTVTPKIVNDDIAPTASVAPTKLAISSDLSTWMSTPSGANLATALTTPLPITGGGTGTTSLGVGIIHSNASVLSSSAVNLASSDVTGVLPAANVAPVSIGTYSATVGTLSAATAGRAAIVTNGGPAFWIADGSAWHPIIGKGLYGTAPPSAGSLTWVNQGSCTATNTNGQLVATCPTSASTANFRGLSKTSAGASAIACGYVQAPGNNTTSGSTDYPAWGVYLRESGTDDICMIESGMQANSIADPWTSVNVSRWTSVTARASVTSNTPMGSGNTNLICLRVRVDSTNIRFEISADLATWRELAGSPIAKATCFSGDTPNESGLMFGIGFASASGETYDVVVQHADLQ